jgi:hypothetical protein
MNDEIPTLQELEQWFINYLAETFGEQLLALIPMPVEYEIGERVLFNLKDRVTVERKEQTQEDADDLHQMLAKTVGGIDGVQVTTELPVTSGLPYPRIIDILDWSVAMDIPAKKYLASNALLPKDDFAIRWLLGVMLWSSRKQLVYIDFTHPKVKTIFSADYDRKHDFDGRSDVYGQLQQFKAARDSLIVETDSDSGVAWAKLVQVDGEMLTRRAAHA